MTLASSLTEVSAIAAPMFADSAVHSVNVVTTFGEVTVLRDGRIFMANDVRE